MFEYPCLIIFMVILGSPIWIFYNLIRYDYALLRRFVRQRKFGLFSTFLMTAVVAVALGLVRSQGIEISDPGWVCAGAVALGIGIVVVGIVWLIVGGYFEREEAARLRTRVYPSDVKVELPPEVRNVS